MGAFVFLICSPGTLYPQEGLCPLVLGVNGRGNLVPDSENLEEQQLLMVGKVTTGSGMAPEASMIVYICLAPLALVDFTVPIRPP